jgi:hypothetical protein
VRWQVADALSGEYAAEFAPSYPSPPPSSSDLWYGLSPSPPPHDVADWGGYTPVPASATLPDRRMCTGYSGYAQSSSTLAQCRASCDSSSGCAGFSWGLNVSSSPSPPPPSPSPPPGPSIDRRRTLLAHDEPAVDGEIGHCYLMGSKPTSSFIVSSAFTAAGCYAKGARLLTWPVSCTLHRLGPPCPPPISLPAPL